MFVTQTATSLVIIYLNKVILIYEYMLYHYNSTK